MTTQVIFDRHTFVAGASLASSQFRLLKLDSTVDQVVVATDGSAPIIGAAQNNPLSGHAVDIASLGSIEKVVASGSVTLGDKITATTGGKGITTTTVGDYYVGFALDSAADGDVFRVYKQPGRVTSAYPSAQSSGWGTPTGVASSFTNWDGTTATAATVAAELAKLITVLKSIGILAA